VDALAALGREERDDVIARRHHRHPRADSLDDAGAFVAEDAGRVAGRVLARCRVEIGVADAARCEADEDLALLRLSEVELLDDERLTELLEDCGADLHRAPSAVERRIMKTRERIPRCRIIEQHDRGGPPWLSHSSRSSRSRTA
jgi:hypothetical protein